MAAMIDPATLVAYLDGELGPAAALRVEAALAEDNALRERLAALRRVDGALSAAFDPILDDTSATAGPGQRSPTPRRGEEVP